MYTYKCGELEWSDDVTIGFNAPPDNYYNHPLTQVDISADEIACVHVDSVWNNVIIDLELNPLILPSTPEPSSFIGIISTVIEFNLLIMFFVILIRFMCGCWVY